MRPNYESIQDFNVSRESFDRLAHYYDLLIKWQKAINLVSPASLSDAWRRHFVDSVQVLKYLPESCRSVVDLGSGGGFAGLVVALCRPDIDVHLIDSDMRKCQFLRTVSRESSADNVTVHNDRVEIALEGLNMGIVMTRGFAGLDKILDLTAVSRENNPALSYLLLKGARYAEEIAQARQLYEFRIDAYASVTESESRILRIEDVNKL